MQLDPTRELEEQEGHPFGVILHKLPSSVPESSGWHQRLERYARLNPSCVVLDSPSHIQRLASRDHMLSVVREMSKQLRLSCSSAMVAAPRQLLLERNQPDILDGLREHTFSLPLLAKPLKADGSQDSHALALVHDHDSLQRLSSGLVSGLEPPCVLQEFVDHGGALFKVYVVGDNVAMTRRKSLPDMHGCSQSRKEGIELLDRVSCAPHGARDDDAETLEPVSVETEAPVEEPEAELVRAIAQSLRAQLGLSLFNFDLIRVRGSGNKFLVIDINYFPGYAKMPGYEAVISDWLRKVATATAAQATTEQAVDR